MSANRAVSRNPGVSGPVGDASGAVAPCQIPLSVRKYRDELEKELDNIWAAQADVTRDEAVMRLVEEFMRAFEVDPLVSESHKKILGEELWMTIAQVLLCDAALKVPAKVEKENQQYLNTQNAVAEFLYELFTGDKATPLSKYCTWASFRNFARCLNSKSWEIRYRVLQLGRKFLDRCFDKEVMFSLSGDGLIKHSEENWRGQVFARIHDTNQKVAAMAVRCLAHYQGEDKPEKSQAYRFLRGIMQEHPTASVRAAALESIAVRPSSVKFIIRGTMDVSPEVRIAAYKIAKELLSPKVLNSHLRSFICMRGLQDSNLEVRTQAVKLVEDWLKDDACKKPLDACEDCGGDAAAHDHCDGDLKILFGGALQKKDPNKTSKQLGMEIFETAPVIAIEE